jgi:hypothetical protein
MRITDQLDDRKIGIWGNAFDVSAPPGITCTVPLTAIVQVRGP